MTKKEDAIGWFTMLREKFTGTKYGEYLDMAINALEQQPCEDCISRKQAIIETYGFIRETGIDEAPFGHVGTILRNLPSVTPKPIIGQWLEVIDDTDSSGRKKNWHYKCSICGNEDSGWGEYNYCPICGAEMKGMRE